MKSLALAIVAAVAVTLAGEPGPVELAGLLGSPDRVEREEAARTLEALGAEALPALRDAEKSAQEGVRGRAASLARSIEGRLLDRPTMVAVDFDGRPLGEAIRALASRSGQALTIDPGGDAGLLLRPIRASDPAPVPFWEALDRVGRAGRVRHDPGAVDREGGSGPSIHLVDGEPPAWTAYRGPFRVHLVGLDRRLDLDLGGAPSRPPATRGVLYAEVQAFVEPGRFLDFDGIPRLEAADDRGRPLPPPPVDADWPSLRTGSWRDPGTIGVLQWRVPLGLPDPRAAGLGRIRGTLPVIVSAGRPDPLVIPLDDPPGRSYRHEGATLRFRIVQDSGKHGLQVELDIRPDPLPPPGSVDRASAPLVNRFSAEDRDGRPLAWLPLSRDVMPDGGTRVRMLISGAARPIRLRDHGLISTAAEIPFEFAEVPLP